MKLVVLLKGVNVGKHRRFLPAALAKELADFDVVNVGAVGTFVVRKAPSAAALRAEIARRLPFEAEMMICTEKEIRALLDRRPFTKKAHPPEVREMVTLLAKRPASSTTLPIRRPDGESWQVELFEIDGRFALALWRPDPKRMIYVDPQKELGISGTTRTWKTYLAIQKALDGAASSREAS
ncbi:MAG TPA: DUF1697 domain-containing protein [Thermoanaerobaculia bacterium]|nr:DUF1697 domain-containing protein [Thermoanaerobaculia bacterium]